MKTEDSLYSIAKTLKEILAELKKMNSLRDRETAQTMKESRVNVLRMRQQMQMLNETRDKKPEQSQEIIEK